MSINRFRRAGLLAFAIVCALSLVSCRKRTVVFKVGGSAKGTIRYQLPDDVIVGEKTLPWETTLVAGYTVTGARVNVESSDGKAWCEVWLDGELCDREDDGHWCACYKQRSGWAGTINDDDAQKTYVP